MDSTWNILHAIERLVVKEWIGFIHTTEVVGFLLVSL